MDKVYISDEFPGCWQLLELTDIFSFGAKVISTGEDLSLILTWTRSTDLSELEGLPIRKYDIELEGEKYFFLLYQKGDKWILKPENSKILEELSQKDIILVGAKFEEI